MTNLTLAGSNQDIPYNPNWNIKAGNINNGGLAQPSQNVTEISRPWVDGTPQYNSLAATLPGSQGIGSKPNGFDWNGAISNFGLGAQGVMGLANAYNAWKQIGLMEEQLGINKSLMNRNISNSALTTNRMLDDQASMAAQMTTGAEYGTPEYLAAKEKLKTTVDGSPVA